MRNSLKALVAGVLVALLIGPQISFAQTESEAEKLFIAASDALGKSDIDTCLSYFSDDAIVTEVPAFTIKSVGTFKGKSQIRQWLQKLITTNTFGQTLGAPQKEPNKVTYFNKITSDELKAAGIAFILETQVIGSANGKITSFTLTVAPDYLSDLQKAGYTSSSTTSSQTQGQSSEIPSGAPTTGFGGSSTGPELDWIVLVLVLMSLMVFSKACQLLLGRKNKNRG